ncbi:MAG TPA: response regulator, partial [Anaerolineales bacterium]|nr:response regulator [Anaerolineales bacterium]
MSKQELILLAMDASPVLGLMERTLRSAGFDVAIAHDLVGLNKCLHEAIPSLMIVGEKFVDQGGFAIAKEILERFPTLPIIFYAEQDTTGYAKTALKMGL